MEKLVYLLWKPPAQEDEAFKQVLLERVAPALGAHGARKLKLSVVDDAVAAGGRLRIGPMDPAKSALVSFWLEQAQERTPLETTIGEVSERIAGYLVLESRPLVNTHRLAAPGERTPGFSAVSCIEPRLGLTREKFLEHWFEVHRDLAIETQSTFGYVRNECVRALTDAAPPWAAIVEESFPSEALSDPAVFYDAVGSAERLEANARRMLDSCRAFLDLQKVDSHPMSEYQFEH
ncbi:MAG: EthD domain-containing protein [Myxococcales bacterium]|nr:EthD domain-containing protein [Myxococcales bacterium]